MRILYIIKLAFQISGERIGYSIEIIVATAKPSGKQESWIQTPMILQNKFCYHRSTKGKHGYFYILQEEYFILFEY